MKKFFLLLYLLISGYIALAQIDSVFSSYNIVPPKIEFTNSSYTTIPQPIVNYQQQWILLYFILGSLFLILIDIKNPNEIKSIFNSLFVWLKLRMFLQDRDNIKNKVMFYLTLFSFSSLPLFFSLVMQTFFKTSFAKTYLTTFVFLIILLLNIMFFSGLIIIIFNQKELIKSVVKIFIFWLISSGITSFILTFISFYVSISLSKITLLFNSFVIILLYIFKSIRQLQTFNAFGFSLFYFILYLCSAELIPILLALTIIKI